MSERLRGRRRELRVIRLEEVPERRGIVRSLANGKRLFWIMIRRLGVESSVYYALAPKFTGFLEQCFRFG